MLQLLLLQLLLLFLLLLSGLLSGLLLARLHIRLVLRGVRLLLLIALRVLDALLRLLRTLLAGLFELTLVIRLFLVVSLLVRSRLRRADTALRLVDRMLALLLLERLFVRGALRGLRIALRFVQLMLTLLVFERLGVTRFIGRALRRLGLILRAPDSGLLVALLCTLHALLVIKRKLLFADVRRNFAHGVAGPVEAVIHEEAAIALMLGDRVAVVVLVATGVECLLACVEIVAGMVRRRGRGRG